MKTAHILLKSAVALAIAAPLMASAESNIVTGASTTTGASADLNFRVVIPEFIALKVGTGPILTNTGTVDTVEFLVSNAQAIADGSVAATSGGTVQVALLSNVGAVDFGSLGADLTDATSGDTIPLSSISAADSGTLAHPAFGTTGSVAPTAGRVVNRSGSWTFSYNHQGSTAPVAAGDYQTTVTYTASKP
jgi:hypothetical protein